jgi:hypothetical protein
MTQRNSRVVLSSGKYLQTVELGHDRPALHSNPAPTSAHTKVVNRQPMISTGAAAIKTESHHLTYVERDLPPPPAHPPSVRPPHFLARLLCARPPAEKTDHWRGKVEAVEASKRPRLSLVKQSSESAWLFLFKSAKGCDLEGKSFQMVIQTSPSALFAGGRAGGRACWHGWLDCRPVDRRAR